MHCDNTPCFTLAGKYQGKGDVPTLWAMTCHTALEAYAKLQPPMQLPVVADATSFIPKWNVSFVDDNDMLKGDLECNEDTVEKVVYDLKSGAQTWTNVLDIVVQSIVFHKSAWQTLAFQEENGMWTPWLLVPYQINLYDAAGAYT